MFGFFTDCLTESSESLSDDEDGTTKQDNTDKKTKVCAIIT